MLKSKYIERIQRKCELVFLRRIIMKRGGTTWVDLSEELKRLENLNTGTGGLPEE